MRATAGGSGGGSGMPEKRGARKRAADRPPLGPVTGAAGRRTGWQPPAVGRDEDGLEDMSAFFRRSDESPEEQQQQYEGQDDDFLLDFEEMPIAAPAPVYDEEDEVLAGQLDSSSASQSVKRGLFEAQTAKKRKSAKENDVPPPAPRRRRYDSEEEDEKGDEEDDEEDEEDEEEREPYRLLQERLPPPQIAPLDWRRYDPFAERPAQHVQRPRRLRVRPVAYWLGEKPVYQPRSSGDNLPQLLGYGRDPASHRAASELPPKMKRLRLAALQKTRE